MARSARPVPAAGGGGLKDGGPPVATPARTGGLRLFGGWTSALVLGLLAAWTARPAWTGDAAFVWHDAIFSEVGIHHLQSAVLGGGDWRALPLARPLPDPITQVDWMLGQAILGLPLRLGGVDPLQVYVVLAMAGLLATALACDRVAAALLGEGPHTWAAGVVGGFAPIQVLHAPHVNLVWHALGPLAVLALAAGLTRGRPWWCFVAGALGPAGFHFGAYVGLHGAVVVAVVLPFVAWGSRRGGVPPDHGAGARGSGAAVGWGAFALGVAVGIATLVPVARVYLGAAEGARIGIKELASESLDLARVLGAHRDPQVWSAWALGLAALGAWDRRRGGWPWVVAAVVVVVGMVLALGPFVQWQGRYVAGPAPWGWLMDAFPPLASLRGPDRWLAVVGLGLAPFVAAGVRRVGRVPRVGIALGVLGTAGLLYGSPAPPFGLVERVEPDPAYALVERTDVPGPLLDRFHGRCRDRETTQLRAMLRHGHPLVGGHYSRDTEALAEVNRRAEGWPSAETVGWLRENGIRLVFDHPPLPPAPEGVTCEIGAGHRLCVLGP